MAASKSFYDKYFYCNGKEQSLFDCEVKKLPHGKCTEPYVRKHDSPQLATRIFIFYDYVLETNWHKMPP